MGYEIHITRKENWTEGDSDKDILLHEWKEYIKSDVEMSSENFAKTVTPSSEVIRIKRDGLALWNRHTNFTKVWFSWFNGKVSVNKPDNEITEKMKKVSKALNANLPGDEGENYTK